MGRYEQDYRQLLALEGESQWTRITLSEGGACCWLGQVLELLELKEEFERSLKFSTRAEVQVLVFGLVQGVGETGLHRCKDALKAVFRDWLEVVIRKEVLALAHLPGLQHKVQLVAFEGRGRRLGGVRYVCKDTFFMFVIQLQ